MRLPLLAGFSLALFSLVACSKPTEKTDAAKAASSAAVTPPPGSAEAPTATNAPPKAAPTSFEDGAKAEVENAVGLGCEAKTKDDWLELLCRKKNGTGGHPLAAYRKTSEPTPEEAAEAEQGRDPAPVFSPTENGVLRMVLRVAPADKDELLVDWTDVSYTLKIADGKARFDWTGNTLELRKTCGALLEESKTLLKEAQKPGVANGVTAGEVGKLMRFGVCQPAGHGAWAVALTNLKGDGADATRRLALSLSIVRVSETGERKVAPIASFKAPPGSLSLGRIFPYDYDDDGQNEAIFSYETLTGPVEIEPPAPTLIWSLVDGEILPYGAAPKVLPGGTLTEQLDPDMRPDLGSYGPFFAFLDADCGAKKCPARLVGPRFFAHSLADGQFSTNDRAAQAAVERACGKKRALSSPLAQRA